MINTHMKTRCESHNATLTLISPSLKVLQFTILETRQQMLKFPNPAIFHPHVTLKA